MPRPRLTEAEKKGKRVTVRFRPEEMTELSGQADMCGLSVSELVRRRSLNKRVILFLIHKGVNYPRPRTN
jgi:hypothetical protein